MAGETTLSPSEGSGNLLLDEQDKYGISTQPGCAVMSQASYKASRARVHMSFGEVHTRTLHLELSEAVGVLKMSHAKKFVRSVSFPCSRDG